MNKTPLRFFAAALLAAWAFDALFWGNTVALNFPIFILICIAAGLTLLYGLNRRANWRSLLLLIPVVAFAFVPTFRQEPLTLGLAYAASLISLGIFAVTYLGGNWPGYNPLDYLYQCLQLLGSIFGRPAVYYYRYSQQLVEEPRPTSRFPYKAVLRGVLIAVPVVALFIWLLSSADAYFQQTISNFFDIFDARHAGDNLLRLCIVLPLAYFITGVFLHAAFKSDDALMLKNDAAAIQPFLGFIETSIVLGAVIGVFLLFVAIQFRYFFGGQANIGPAGFTYSTYARRGFTEMVIVAVLSLILNMSLSLITRFNQSSEKRLFNAACIALAIEVLVILTSAFERLSLAIDWHGYSRLRLYPLIFMVWIGALFIAVVALDILSKKRFYTLAIILTSLGFAASLGVVNIDAAIVHHNVQRAVAGKHFNVGMLSSLSPDAVPALVEEYNNPALPAPVKEGVGAALACYRYTRAYSDPTLAEWRVYNASVAAAVAALKQSEQSLSGYTVSYGDHSTLVTAPGGTRYQCLQDPCEDSSYCD